MTFLYAKDSPQQNVKPHLLCSAMFGPVNSHKEENSESKNSELSSCNASRD